MAGPFVWGGQLTKFCSRRSTLSRPVPAHGPRQASSQLKTTLCVPWNGSECQQVKLRGQSIRAERGILTAHDDVPELRIHGSRCRAKDSGWRVDPLSGSLWNRVGRRRAALEEIVESIPSRARA